MFYLKNLILLGLLVVSFAFPSPSYSIGEVSDLDLQGDGKMTRVTLPFPYLSLSPTDKPHMIYEGGYKAFDVSLDSSDVIILGPLRPCIGVMVTDGKKAVAFHKHCTNALATETMTCRLVPTMNSMEGVLSSTLDLSNPNQLYARIFTTQDDTEWKNSNRTPMHGNKSHLQAVLDIALFLHKCTGVPKTHILGQLYNIRTPSGELKYADHTLGQYEKAELCSAIRVRELFKTKENGIQEIQFFSTDYGAEDIFGYRGKMITYGEFTGPAFEAFKAANPQAHDITRDTPLMLYDKAPFTNQRGILDARLESEEERYYQRYFQKTANEVLMVRTKDEMPKAYNSLPFYPID